MNNLNNLFNDLSIDNDIIKIIVNELVERVVIITNNEITSISVLISNNTIHNLSNEPSLKLAHLYCLKHQISAQCSGTLIEAFIINKYNMIKNKSSLMIGDANKNGANYEIKISLGGKDRNRFNYVQIRLNHICNYLLTAYYICPNNVDSFGELFIFRLNKRDMLHILSLYGSYAHGTIKKLGIINVDSLSVNNNNNEYALRIKYNSACWNKLLEFRINAIDI